MQSFEIYKVGMLQKSYADAGNFEIAQFFILQRFRTRITQQKRVLTAEVPVRGYAYVRFFGASKNLS